MAGSCSEWPNDQNQIKTTVKLEQGDNKFHVIPRGVSSFPLYPLGKWKVKTVRLPLDWRSTNVRRAGFQVSGEFALNGPGYNVPLSHNNVMLQSFSIRVFIKN